MHRQQYFTQGIVQTQCYATCHCSHPGEVKGSWSEAVYGMLCDLVISLCRRVQKAEPYRLTGAAAPLAIQSKEHGRQPGSFIAGFVKGANAAPFAIFPAPKVPASYQPVHKFAGPLLTGTTAQPRAYMRVNTHRLLHNAAHNAVHLATLCDPANALSGTTLPFPVFCKQCLSTLRTNN